MSTSQLSARQQEVLQALIDGNGEREETAKHLCISNNTFISHMQNIYKALGVHSIQSAVIVALRRGIVQL